MALVESNESNVPSENEIKLPQKRFYRQRAHANPIADHTFDYPISPDQMNWSSLYPHYFGPDSNQENHKQVEFLDIGCGYGGLLITLARMHPEVLCLGMEIRLKVCDFVNDKIAALRKQAIASNSSEHYQNCAVLRMNAMKYLPNHFRKGQLQKMFFLFPDPHFKNKKHKWRIISQQLLAEYAFVLADEAKVYFVTDVKDLFDWMDSHFDQHPLFQRVSQPEIDSDPIVPKLFDSSEEGQKVTRNKGEKWFSIFKRVPNQSN